MADPRAEHVRLPTEPRGTHGDPVGAANERPKRQVPGLLKTLILQLLIKMSARILLWDSVVWGCPRWRNRGRGEPGLAPPALASSTSW